MKNYINYLSSDTVRELVTLYGQGLQDGYLAKSAEFSFLNSEVLVSAIAISLHSAKEFLVIKNDWIGDTEQYALDCHKLEISFEEKPIFFSLEEHVIKEKSLRGIESFSSVSFYRKRAFIQKIEIYTHTEVEEDEFVEYDAGFVIYVDEGEPIVIQVNENIIGGLKISQSLESLEKLKNKYKLREI